jgi:hypothetical protein
MSEQPKDGGPAFPRPAVCGEGFTAYEEAVGMSLRDWFAGRATQADIDAHQDWQRSEDGPFVPDCTREHAKYRYADAMLAAREVPHDR